MLLERVKVAAAGYAARGHLLRLPHSERNHATSLLNLVMDSDTAFQAGSPPGWCNREVKPQEGSGKQAMPGTSASHNGYG